MPNENWDLDSIISESDRAEVKRISLAGRGKESIHRILCRMRLHRYSSWNQVNGFCMRAINQDTGETVEEYFELSMRYCFKCGKPGVRLRRA